MDDFKRLSISPMDQGSRDESQEEGGEPEPQRAGVRKKKTLRMVR
jgi:hypothetical protein